MTDPAPPLRFIFRIHLRALLRCVFVVSVIGVLIFAMQIREGEGAIDEILPPPPLVDRLPLHSNGNASPKLTPDVNAETNASEEEKTSAATPALASADTETSTAGAFPKGPTPTREDPVPASHDTAAASPGEADTTHDSSVADKGSHAQTPKTAEGDGGAASGTASTTEQTPPTKKTAADFRREEITSPIPEAYVVIYLKRRFMGICLGKEYIRQYHNIAVPKDLSGPKRASEDQRSPIGTYYVCERKIRATGRLLQVSYPSPSDAKSARALGTVDLDIERAVTQAYAKRQTPPQDTALGGEVFISDQRDAGDQTQSGFAIEPGQFEEVWTATRQGAWVIIRP